MKKNNYLIKAAAATTLLFASSFALKAAYPAAGSFDGTYKFTADSYTFNPDYQQVEPYFPAEFTFDIVTVGGEIQIQNFFNTVGINTGTIIDTNLTTTYDQSTGILSITTYAVKPDVDLNKWFAFCVDGVFTGITADKGTPMKVQIGENGSIGFPDFSMITFAQMFGEAQIKDTVVTYGDITVEPYVNDVTPPEDEEPFPGTEALEGLWSVTLNDHYQGDESLNEFNLQYKASVEGRTLRLVPQEEKGEGDYDIIGVFTDANTLEIKKIMVRDAYYPLYMIPYINTTGTSNMEELEEESFIMKVVQTNGTYTLQLPTLASGSKCGVKYGTFNKITGALNQEWLAAFDFVSFKRTSDFVPTITISTLRPVTTGRSVTVNFVVETEYFDDIVPAKWQAELTQYFSDNVLEEDWTENYTVDATVADGTGTFTFDGCKAGRNDFQVYITALDANGNVIANSNSKSFTAEADNFFDINNVNWTVDENELTVTCKLTPHNITFAQIASYEGVLTAVEGEEQYTTVEATCTSTGIFTGKFNMPNDGTFDFTFEVNGYDESGNMIAITNIEAYLDGVIIGTGGSDGPDTPGDSGVAGIEAENGAARYYNLQGVEVANPRGGIFIKIEGGKAEKLVIK